MAADFTGAQYGADEVLAGIKRDELTGIPPQNLTLFTASGGDSKATLRWSIPTETMIEDQVVCTTKGIMIRRKLGGYPESITDGDLVVNTNVLTGSHEDTGLTNDVPVYYSAFAYSDHGVHNLNTKNRATCTPKEYVLYGFTIDKNNADPATSVAYTDMAVGMTPASVNLSTGAFNPGSWDEEIFFRKNNHVWMVKSNGQPDYQLQDNDYSKKLDGSASDVGNQNYDGNAMVRFDRVWIKIWEDTSLIHVQICDVQLDDDFHAHAFTRADGSLMDYIWMSAFEGSLISNKVRSLSGKTPMNTQTGANEITWAEANGSLWSTQSWSQIQMINMLLVLMGKSLNTQAVFGNGHTTGGSQASHLLATGTASTRGAFYGTSGNVAMKVFHIENYWGDIWNRIRGCVTDGNKQILVKNVPPYNTAGTGYEATGVVPSGTSGGYISQAKVAKDGLVPQVASGSESTRYCDGLWFAASCYALVGGGCGYGAPCGAFALAVDAAVSSTYWCIGAALSCEQPS